MTLSRFVIKIQAQSNFLLIGGVVLVVCVPSVSCRLRASAVGVAFPPASAIARAAARWSRLRAPRRPRSVVVSAVVLGCCPSPLGWSWLVLVPCRLRVSPAVVIPSAARQVSQVLVNPLIKLHLNYKNACLYH